MISLFLFIYLFLAALGLCCYMWAFSSCVSRDYSPVAVCEPLIAVASFFAKDGRKGTQASVVVAHRV